MDQLRHGFAGSPARPAGDVGGERAGPPACGDDEDVLGRGDEGPEEGGGTLVTPGVNLYLGGLNRIMFNWDFWNPLTGESQNSFKTQFQLAF